MYKKETATGTGEPNMDNQYSETQNVSERMKALLCKKCVCFALPWNIENYLYIFANWIIILINDNKNIILVYLFTKNMYLMIWLIVAPQKFMLIK